MTNKKSSKGLELSKEKILTKNLTNLAFYLEGMKTARGNLLPLGNEALNDLWKAICYLNGDERYTRQNDEP